MMKEIKILTKAQLCNFFDMNVLRFSKDKRKKARAIGILVSWAIIFAMIVFYIGALSYSYIMIGLEEVLPMYLIMISGFLVLFFGIFKAGSVIFQRNYYEMLCSLPVSQTAVVVSRFLGMYAGNLLLVLVVMISGIVVYGSMCKQGIGFYLWGIMGTIFIPLLPMTIATLFGALVTGIASRMKHKSLVSSGLTVLLIVGIMMLSSSLETMEENFTVDMLENFSDMITSMIGKLYPPAVWLGNAMLTGNVIQGFLYFGVSVIIFIGMVWAVASNFRKICQRLYSTTAKHDYQMKELKSSSALSALYKKELKRYFASSIYVTNTIIGPIMMVILAGSVFVMGIEQIEAYLPIPGGITELMPFALAVIACLMTTTCTSISMEGKEWWIIKSLPISAKTVFDSKLLLNLTLMAPFYAVSEILLIPALKPGLMDLIWLLILPALFMVFACVFGITINLLFPVFDWENEAAVVKQGASSMIGGLGGSIVILICVVPVVLITQIPTDIVKLVITIIMTGITIWLYQRNAKVDLKKIGE